MKYILILLAAIVLTDCKKSTPEGKYCYTCNFSRSVAGYQKPQLDTCSNTPANSFHFTDPYNNDITFICTPK